MGSIFYVLNSSRVQTDPEVDIMALKIMIDPTITKFDPIRCCGS